MRVLFIGGAGIISTARTRLAAARGIDLTLQIDAAADAAFDKIVEAYESASTTALRRFLEQ
jgi:NADPH:quinone reductase-like Zn-dependent oxidoreductase